MTAEQALLELLAVPLGDFVTTRNALAKRLRTEGDEQGADEIAKMRKPALPLWTINHLARSEQKLIQELIDSAAKLTDAVTAGRAEEARGAAAERQRVIRKLVTRAEALLEAAGESVAKAQLDRISKLLYLATTDRSVHDDLLTGRLLVEPQAGELGGLGLGELSPQTAGDEADSAARDEATALEREAGALEEQATDLDSQASALERDARRARSDADSIRKRALKARERATRLTS